MANEIVYSGLGDLRLAEDLNRALEILVADLSTALWGHEALMYKGDLSGSASSVTKVGQIGVADRMAAVAELASPSNTAITDDSYQITVSRQALQRTLSGLAILTDSINSTQVGLWAQQMIMAAALRFVEVVAALVGGFTATVGTTTVDLDVDNVFEAQFALTNANASGQPVCLLYPQQFTDFQSSLRAETGVIQFQTPSAEMLMFGSPGYKGRWNGIDFLTSSLVPTANAGADSAGGMFVRGAIGWADATQTVQSALNNAILMARKVVVRIDEDISADTVKIVGSYYFGAAQAQDSLGVSMITDR